MGSVRHRLEIGNVLNGKGRGDVNVGDTVVQVLSADSMEISADDMMHSADEDQ